MSSIDETISANLDAVNQRIAAAAARVGRDAADVKLVAVTKYAEEEWVASLTRLHPVFGENRPQQLAKRVPEFDPAVEWHLIGQLQRNKVRMSLPLAHMIHSIDSFRLLDRVELVASELGLKPRVLLEINVSGESAKAGFEPNALTDNLEQLSNYKCANIVGLMGMAPAGAANATRPYFQALYKLREEIRTQTKLSLPELSMGMSGDFEVAIEEGATIVRVGSRLFEGLGYRA